MVASNSSNLENVAFWYREDGDTDYILLENVTQSSEGEFTYNGFSQTSSTYDLKINSTSTTDSPVLQDVVRDTVKPNTASSQSPSDKTGSTSPEVSLDATDELSGVDKVFLNVTDSDGDEVDETVGTSLDLDDLSEETYTVEYTIFDNAENTRESSWEFDVDTTADFDLGLSSGDFDPEPGMIEMDGDQDIDITLNDLGEDGEARCLDGDGDEIDAEDVNDGEDVEFTCELDEDDYGGSTVDLEVEVCDEVDNCATSDDSYEFGLDQYSPSVLDLSTDSGATSFNTEFDVAFDASDDVSGVENVEYYFNEFENYGDGTDLEYSEDTDTYTVDPSSLDSGEHTLKVRAEDGAGQWSDPAELDFSYYPDQDYSLALGVPENFSVTAGNTESFNVEVENDGDIFVPGFSLEASSDFFSESQDISGLTPGESVTLKFEVSPSDEDIGVYDLEISSESPSTSQSFEVLVEANQEQQQNIESTFEEYQTKLEDLEQNVTALKSSGLSEERNQRLDSNFSEFKQTVEDAEAAVGEGDYYRAEEILSDIDERFSTAQETYETVKQEQKKAQTRQTILMVLLGFVVLASSGVGYLAYSDEYQVDVETLKQKVNELDIDLDLGGDGDESSSGGSALEGIKSTVSGLFESESSSSEEDIGWEGFKEE